MSEVVLPKRGAKNLRKGGAHVRTGCGTCKIRRKKCGEEKPACLNCQRTGRNCDGYVRQQLGTTHETPSLLYSKVIAASQSAITDPRSAILKSPEQKQFFDFFHCQTRPQINFAFGSSTHAHQLILQASHSNASVMHTVVAIGAVAKHLFDRRPLLGDSPGCTDNLEHAQLEYLKAVAELQNYISHPQGSSTSLVLVSCLLLTLLDFLRGDYQNAQLHLTAGINILFNHYPTVIVALQADPLSTAEVVDPLILDLARIFTVSNLYATIWLGDCISPSIPRLHPRLIYPLGVPTATLGSNPILRELANSLISQIVRDNVFDHTNIAHGAQLDGDRSLVNTKAEKEVFLYGLKHWYAEFSTYLSKEGKISSLLQRNRVSLLLMAYHSLFISLTTSPHLRSSQPTLLPSLRQSCSAVLESAHNLIPLLSTSTDLTTRSPASHGVQTAWPTWRKELLKAVAANCEEPDPENITPFAFVIGAIQPLFIVATKALEEWMVDDAIKLLEGGGWREGAWDSRVMAELARKNRIERRPLKSI